MLSLIALGLQITFNGGGRWEELQKPEHYRHAVCNRCAAMHDPSKCQLHLHGPSSWHEGPGELHLHQQMLEICEGKHLAKTTNTALESPARFVRTGFPNISKNALAELIFPRLA